MRSSFFEYTVAISGLFTARTGLDVVAHNVANASTQGYSRQVPQIRATSPLTFYNSRGMIGTGSEVYTVKQVRDVYLDTKYWSRMGTLGEYSVKRTQLSLNESILAEVDGGGLSTQFNSFFETIQDLITNSGDITYRTNVVQDAKSLTTLLSDTYEAFLKQQREINVEINTMVGLINSYGTQIRALNEKIKVMESTGSEASDLRDQRALLVDELSRYVNIEAYETEVTPGDKRYTVKINGQDFVTNFDLRTLVCKERSMTDEDEDGNPTVSEQYRNPEDNAGMYDIYWSGSEVKFNVYHPNLTGELKGLIDLRDGNNGNYASATAQIGAYNQTTGELTLALDEKTRIDLVKSGGVIRVTDSKGRTRELTYSSFVLDEVTGTAVFQLSKGSMIDLDSTIAASGGENPFDTPGNITKVTIGETCDYKGIPYYLNRLNNLARTFASAFNFGRRLNGTAIDGVIGHTEGYNLNGEQLGTLFFSYRDPITNEVISLAEYNRYDITALNIIVNPDLIEDPSLLSASDSETGGVDNNNVVLSFLNINTDNTLFSEGRLLDFIIGMTGEMAIDVKQATNFEKCYTDVTTQIDTQRMSISGVDVNEEMVDMVRYNQQYQAAAKLINIIDGIYDTLVNRLGSF